MVASISPAEAAELLTNPDVDIVDVRDEEEFSQGHLPRARALPLEKLRADPEHANLHEGVIFVCQKGVRSIAAAKLAERLGFSKLYSLEGGTNGWVRAGFDLVVGF